MIFFLTFYLSIGFIGALTNLYTGIYQRSEYSIGLRVRQSLVLFLAWPVITVMSYVYRNEPIWE